MLRELVQQRLNMAIQDIFQLFEQTLAEYKEELGRTKEENVRQRELLEAFLQPQVQLHAIDIQQVSVDTQKHEDGQSEHLHIKEETWSGRDEQSDCAAFTQVPGVSVKSEVGEAHQQDDKEADEVKPNMDDVVSRSFNSEPAAQEPSVETSEEFESPNPKMNTPDDPELPHVKEEDDNDDPQWTVPNDDRVNPESSNLPLKTKPIKPDGDAGPSCAGGFVQGEPSQGGSSDDITSHSSDEAPKKAKKQFPCSECGKTFSNRGILTRHMKSHTSEKPFSCPACEKTFSRHDCLRSHLRCHTREKPFHCSLCTQTFRHRQNLRSHLRSHTGEKPFSCPTCGSTFSTRANLKRHVSMHTREKRAIRQKRFTTKGNVVLHTRTHTGEKPFTCTVCDGAFTTKWQLMRHARTHTGDKPFWCSVCYQRFTLKDTMLTHLEEHAREAPYTCVACPATFDTRKELSKHNCTHVGEKLHPCPVCSKRFSRKSNMTAHMKGHSGEKPFTCPVCNKGFVSKAVMVRHGLTHTGERPFGCDVCHKKFTRKLHVTKHKCPGVNDYMDNLKESESV
nr:gastrula zinc finger protein XlCGF57.1-like [Nerophis lumbriciformis]